MAWAFARRRATRPARRVGATWVLAVAAACSVAGAARAAQAAPATPRSAA
ncbi:cellulase, partial [Burkholderia latens]